MIHLVTDDQFLILAVKDYFKKEEIIVSKEIKIQNNNEIYLDDLSSEEFFILSLKANIKKVLKPFVLQRLISEIQNFIKNNLKQRGVDLVKLKFCTVNLMNKTIIKNKAVLGVLTEKEVEVLKYLFYNTEVTKEKLLKDVWGYKDNVNSRVVENIIYKIRQKFKKYNLPCPILFEQSIYKLNNN